MPNSLNSTVKPIGILVYRRGAPPLIGIVRAWRNRTGRTYADEVQVEWQSGVKTWSRYSAFQSVDEKLEEDLAAVKKYYELSELARKHFGI